MDHMHNDTRVCGHTLFIESGKPQTIKTGDENVFQPLISQFCQHAQPEPRLFVLLYPHYQQHLSDLHCKIQVNVVYDFLLSNTVLLCESPLTKRFLT